jgi:hypothetical protein
MAWRSSASLGPESAIVLASVMAGPFYSTAADKGRRKQLVSHIDII